MLNKSLLSILAGLLIFSGSAHALKKSKSYSVNIENMKFNTENVTAQKGDTVVWTNNDLVPHTVTALDQSFDSKVIDAGKTWTLVLKKIGITNYKCTFHPSMIGKITVQ